MYKRMIAIALVALLALTGLFATPLMWRISIPDVNYVRYAFDGSPKAWTIVETTGSNKIEVLGEMEKDIIISVSNDKVNWSNTIAFHYNPETKRQEKVVPAGKSSNGLSAGLSVTPFTWSRFNFKNDLFEDLSSKYGFSAKADAQYQGGLWFVGGSVGLDYTKYEFTSLLGVSVDAFGPVTAYAKAGAGAELALMGGSGISPEAFAGIGAEYGITEDLSVKAEVLCKYSYYGSSDSAYVANAFGVDAYVGVSKQF